MLFLWYNEEENDFVELETTLDEENSTVSITATHFSNYMVIDKYKWFEAWAVEFDYNPTGGGSGEPTRPYIQRGINLLIDEIMQAQDPIKDPGGLVSGLRWNVAGSLNGVDGIWELVIDTSSNTIVHFLFNSHGGF